MFLRIALSSDHCAGLAGRGVDEDEASDGAILCQILGREGKRSVCSQ